MSESSSKKAKDRSPPLEEQLSHVLQQWQPRSQPIQSRHSEQNPLHTLHLVGSRENPAIIDDNSDGTTRPGSNRVRTGTNRHPPADIAPCQDRPYFLPDDAVSCPFLFCAKSRRTYSKRSKLESHMQRRHKWPRIYKRVDHSNDAISRDVPNDNRLKASPGPEVKKQEQPLPELLESRRSMSREPAFAISETRKRTADGKMKLAPANTNFQPQLEAMPAPLITIQSWFQEKTRRLVMAVNNALSSRPASWHPAEDELLFHVREDLRLKWRDIEPFFLYRGNWHLPQSRYSKLSRQREREYKDETQCQVALPQDVESIDPYDNGTSIYPDGTIAIATSAVPTSKPRRSDRAGAQSKAGAFSKFFHIRNIHDEEWADADDETEKFLGLQNESSIAELPPKTGTPQNIELIPPRKSSYARESLHWEMERNRAAFCSMSPKIARSPASLPTSISSRKGKRRSVRIYKPYLSRPERSFLAHTTNSQDEYWDVTNANVWEGQQIHVDFTETEIKALEQSALCVVPSLVLSLPQRERLAVSLKDVKANDIERIAFRAIHHGPFLNRTVDSIKSFLTDLVQSSGGGDQNLGDREQPYIKNLVVSKAIQQPGFDALLLNREIGNSVRFQGGWFRSNAYKALGRSHVFTGTSSDVNTVAWAPNGRFFAVGSTAWTDPNSMQYNRPNNLLFGDVEKSRLLELPHHCKKREAPQGGTVNDTAAMQASQDPLLFTSISDVQFSPDSRVLISAGYDNFVRLFEVGKASQGIIRPAWSLAKQSEVDLLALPTIDRLFAAATKTFKAGNSTNAVRLYSYQVEDDTITHCRKERSFCCGEVKNMNSRLDPSSLSFSKSPGLQKWLLGGFTAHDDEEKRGEACLWDIETGKAQNFGKQNVFDMQWSPSIWGRFAVASSPAPGSRVNRVNRGTQSVIRMYDSRWLLGSTHAMTELECPGLDINDVLFNAQDDYLFTAGCTNGIVYVWDLRRPDIPLHQLGHGNPLSELELQYRETVDTGIRFVSWDHNGRQLLTGSSDGVVASWNPYVAPQNAFNHEVVRMDSGIMAGAFSPDFSNLLLGDVQGSILTLGVGCDDDDAAQFEFVADENTKSDKRGETDTATNEQNSSSDSGAQIARELVRTGQIDIKPLGNFPRQQAVQGPSYLGPFDGSSGADDLRIASAEFQAAAAKSTCGEDGPARPAAGSFTDSDAVDEGAWRQRIPQQIYECPLGEQATVLDSCARCTDLLIKSTSTSLSAASLNDPEKTVCGQCGACWRGDVLGYELINGPPDVSASIALKKTSTTEATGSKLRPVQTLEFYHGLWEINQLALR